MEPTSTSPDIGHSQATDQLTEEEVLFVQDVAVVLSGLEETLTVLSLALTQVGLAQTSRVEHESTSSPSVLSQAVITQVRSTQSGHGASLQYMNVISH
jgi:hypothetical protein